MFAAIMWTKIGFYADYKANEPIGLAAKFAVPF